MVVIKIDEKKLGQCSQIEPHLPLTCERCPFRVIDEDPYGADDVCIYCNLQYDTCYTRNIDGNYWDANDNPVENSFRPKECPLISIEEEA